MAKPTYSIGGLDLATLQKIEAFLSGGAVGHPATAAPAPAVVAAPVPAAPPIPPMPLPPMPAAPVAPVAPPAPPMPVAPPAPVASAAGPTMQDVIKSMADAVARCGAAGAGKVAPLMAQFNAQAPGTPGPVSSVDPAQYGNLKAALDALQP